MLPLSFIAEYEYCPRSAYWLLTDTPRSRDENAFIQDGRETHQAVDAGYEYSKTAKRVESSVRVFSETHGINGKADIVEFHADGEIVPVELKRGRKRANGMHEMQLALMGLCLREMFPDAIVRRGAIFFAEDRQKVEVELTDALIEKAIALAKTVNEKAKHMDPRDFPAMKDERCQGCCFYDLCYP